MSDPGRRALREEQRPTLAAEAAEEAGGAVADEGLRATAGFREGFANDES